jgi:hypothetical protein
MPFDGPDQLLNIDWLGKERTPIDTKTGRQDNFVSHM